MKLLLDTHIALWLATDRQRLSAAELGAVIDPENELLISSVSIWELQLKWNRKYRSGVRKGPVNPLGLLAALEKIGLNVEPLSALQAASSLVEPMQHSDPFDELLLTIAQETGYRLLTRDEKLRGHPLAFHAD